MKSINLLTHLRSREDISEKDFILYAKLECQSPSKVTKSWEEDDLASFCHEFADEGYAFFDDFFYNFKIEQISKEFDLLRIGQNDLINIELKHDATKDRILKQLVQNRYYLAFLDTPIYSFTYIAKTHELYMFKDNDIVLCDFGIAFFNPEEYEYTGHTLYKEVLGNRKFSEPEQANRGTVPHVTMDIYALGQIMQWFVIGDTHSGTGRKTLNTVLNKRLIYGLDQIIDKCLRSDPKERYQSMEELYMDIDKFGIKLIEKLKEETIDDFFKDDYEVEQDGLGIGEKIVVI